MKTLILVRHAKSSWDDDSLDDKSRPLNDRGLRDAPKMGERLAKRGVTADLILSSPAVRALTTAEIIAKAISYKRKDIVVNDAIYESSPDKLLDIVYALDDGLACVMLFGHNPELTELAHQFDSGIDDMPTCAVAEFTFNVLRWSEIGSARPAKVVFETPKKSS